MSFYQFLFRYLSFFKAPFDLGSILSDILSSKCYFHQRFILLVKVLSMFGFLFVFCSPLEASYLIVNFLNSNVFISYSLSCINFLFYLLPFIYVSRFHFFISASKALLYRQELNFGMRKLPMTLLKDDLMVLPLTGG